MHEITKENENWRYSTCFQRHAYDIDIFSLEGDNLVIPLTPDTYPFCWHRAFLGVVVDGDEEVLEENENNNIGYFSMILDCGGRC